MEQIVDIVLLLVLLLFIGIGAKRGIARSALELAAFFTALFLAFSACTPLAAACYDSLLSDRTTEKIEQKLTEEPKKALPDTVSVSDLGIPSFLEPFAEKQLEKLNTLWKDIRMNGESRAQLAAQIEESFVRPVALKGLSALFFLCLAVLLCVLLQTLAVLLSKLFKLPVIGAADTVLGGIFGAFKGCVLVLLLAIFALLAASELGGDFQKAVNASQIIRLLQTALPSLLSL